MWKPMQVQLQRACEEEKMQKQDILIADLDAWKT